MLRLLAFKLNSIGYRGPLLGNTRSGATRTYSYIV